MHDSEEQAADAFSVRLLADNEHDDHRAVLRVAGEIDLATAPTLREALQMVLEHRTGPVVVDLCEVAFMDSTGVHVLAEMLRRLENRSRPLAIVCHEDGQVHRLLGVVGLLDAVILSSSGDAVHRLTRAAGSADDAAHAVRSGLATASR